MHAPLLPPAWGGGGVGAGGEISGKSLLGGVGWGGGSEIFILVVGGEPAG